MSDSQSELPLCPMPAARAQMRDDELPPLPPCVECASAERLPYMYRFGCIGCLARQLKDVPRAHQQEAMVRLLDTMSAVEWAQLLVAMRRV